MNPPHWLRMQLAGPHGFLARPMAHLLNRINGSDYQRALVALTPSAGQTVLELGFGGGIGVDRLLKQGVKVIASEPSQSMRQRGYRRWSNALAAGHLTIWSHTAESLPDTKVDYVLSLNTVYFWKDLELGFQNLRRVTQKRVVLGIAGTAHLRKAGFNKEGFRLEEMSWYQDKLETAGFRTSVIASATEDHCAFLVGDIDG